MNAYSKISTTALQGCDPAELGQLRLRRTTRSIPSSTVVGGHLAIRLCFINPHTRLADVDALVDHVIAIGDELTALQSG